MKFTSYLISLKHGFHEKASHAAECIISTAAVSVLIVVAGVVTKWVIA